MIQYGLREILDSSESILLNGDCAFIGGELLIMKLLQRAVDRRFNRILREDLWLIGDKIQTLQGLIIVQPGFKQRARFLNKNPWRSCLNTKVGHIGFGEWIDFCRELM